jgi:hypothetical protein
MARHGHASKHPCHRRMCPNAPSRWRSHATLVQLPCQRSLPLNPLGTQPLYLKRQAVCRTLRRLLPRPGRSRRTGRLRWPPPSIPAQNRPACPRCRKRRPGALRNELPPLLRHRGIDPRHHVICPGHVGGSDRDSNLQQLREGVGAPGNPIEAGGYQDGPELAAAGQGCLEPRLAVVLAAGITPAPCYPSAFTGFGGGRHEPPCSPRSATVARR